MGIWAWTSQNWFDLLSAAGIVASLLFTRHTLRSEARTRRVANLIAITANHREVWKVLLSDPRLARVLEASTDTSESPITGAERTFVGMVILHVNSVYFAERGGLIVEFDGWRRDISRFLALPVPGVVWEEVKGLQNEKFKGLRGILPERRIAA